MISQLRHVLLGKPAIRSLDVLRYLVSIMAANDAHGIRSDPAEVNAVLEITAPSNASDLRQFIGLVNPLRNFIAHVPGAQKYLSDSLSCAPLPISDPAVEEICVESEVYTSTFLGFLLASSTKLAEIKAAQTADNTCQRIVSFTKNGWPAKDTLDDEIKKYLPIAAELNVQQNLLLRGSRIIIPPALRSPFGGPVFQTTSNKWLSSVTSAERRDRIQQNQ